MRKEIVTLGIILGALSLSELAFSRPVRKQAGNLTGWTCAKCPKSFWDGWLIDINHIKPVWEGGGDEPSNAEPLCLEDHYKFHKNRGNGEDKKASRLILSRIQHSHGGRTRSWIAKHGTS